MPSLVALSPIHPALASAYPMLLLLLLLSLSL
jgi:hypothetical protein